MSNPVAGSSGKRTQSRVTRPPSRTAQERDRRHQELGAAIGLVETATDENDRGRKVLRVTPQGDERLTTAARAWTDAQSSFESAFGKGKPRELRGILKSVANAELGGT